MSGKCIGVLVKTFGGGWHWRIDAMTPADVRVQFYIRNEWEYSSANSARLSMMRAAERLGCELFSVRTEAA